MNDDRDRQGPAWSRLYADRQPPPDLEERAVDAWRASLGEEQVVTAWKGQQRAHAPSRVLVRLAASLVLFGAGWGAARLAGPAAPVEPPAEMSVVPATAPAPAYMFLLWEGPDFEMSSPDGGSQEYAAWARGVADGGIRLSGDELSSESVTVTAPGTAPGPAEEAVLSGYFLVEAPDATTALELARGHPHLGHGGWVEVASVVRR